MQTFNEYFTLIESAKSDKFEKDLAKHISKTPGMEAERPSVGTGFSDIRLTRNNGASTWLEVKMNHSDQLSNPRVFYNGTTWQTTYTTRAAQEAVTRMNKSKMTKAFIKGLADYSGIKKPFIATNKGQLKKEKNVISLKTMKEYVSQPGFNRYVLSDPDVDLGGIVTDHYINGKTEPAFYMQAGDDFYMIGRANPLGVPSDVPLLAGKGSFKMRVGTRSEYYEVQGEIKIHAMKTSKYSLLPGTKKKNPFK